MSGSPKTVKRLPAPVFFSSSPMSRSAFIRTISTGMRPSLRTPATLAKPSSEASMLTPSSSVRPVTCGSKAKPRIAEQVDVVRFDRLARRLLDERRADGAVLRADRDRDPRRGVPIRLAVALTDRLDVVARVGLERRERDPLLPAAVLDAGLREVVEDRLLEVGCVGVLRGFRLGERSRAVAERERAVRAQRLDCERAGDADLLRPPRMALSYSSSNSA